MKSVIFLLFGLVCLSFSAPAKKAVVSKEEKNLKVADEAVEHEEEEDEIPEDGDEKDAESDANDPAELEDEVDDPEDEDHSEDEAQPNRDDAYNLQVHKYDEPDTDDAYNLPGSPDARSG